MSESIVDRWVAALRSGDYPQGKRALNGRDGFCCLGVLCELAVADGVVKHAGRDAAGEMRYTGDVLSYTAMPPTAVETWFMEAAGWPAGNLWETSAGYLPKLNDEGASFAEIADLIEATYASTEVAS